MAVVRLPVAIVVLVGVYYAYTVLIRLTEDTSHITNFAFGVSASLSALSFSAARALPNPPELSDRFAFAGERLLHAAILLITASILKFTAVALGTPELPSLWSEWELRHWPALIGLAAFSFPGPILFLTAVLAAHDGLVVLNRLLWERMRRHPDADSFF